VVGVALRGDERQYNTLNTVTKTVPITHGKLRTMSRPKKIKTAMWVGEKQWASLKALADRLEFKVPRISGNKPCK
jgi:hypothetical protein